MDSLGKLATFAGAAVVWLGISGSSAQAVVVVPGGTLGPFTCGTDDRVFRGVDGGLGVTVSAEAELDLGHIGVAGGQTTSVTYPVTVTRPDGSTITAAGPNVAKKSQGTSVRFSFPIAPEAAPPGSRIDVKTSGTSTGNLGSGTHVSTHDM